MTSSNDINQFIRHHPSIIQPNEISDVISPLKTLDINYFGHARVDKDGNVAGPASNPHFLSYYYQKGFHHYDMHSGYHENGTHYVLWDYASHTNETEALYLASHEFGVHHTFSLINITEHQKDFYHFGTIAENTYMNEFYLHNIDLLKQFICYYNELLLKNVSLNKVYDFSFKPKYGLKGYKKSNKNHLPSNELKKLFLKNISPSVSVAPRELECARLMLNGFTAKEIAKQLGVSFRTVEEYFIRLKKKFSAKNKCHLAKILAQFFGPLL